MNERNTLCKSERINSRLLIEELFSGKSKSFSIYPIRTVFMPIEQKEECVANILVSVPKKRFKHAVKRNRVKRQIKEAYRKNKHELLNSLQEKQIGLAIAFIYLSDEIISSQELESKIITTLARINEKISV